MEEMESKSENTPLERHG